MGNSRKQVRVWSAERGAGNSDALVTLDSRDRLRPSSFSPPAYYTYTPNRSIKRKPETGNPKLEIRGARNLQPRSWARSLS